ncbi:uncharacterized protein LOC128392685 [Panonychus citri]|uniref:uncharacterized protein LOC128392685 n=1 Tax=Panonychus citri TaxID=50023 RepID=UPI0023079369|nr:uncharacterized protein LOC128392685 [Panonychus citri]
MKITKSTKVKLLILVLIVIIMVYYTVESVVELNYDYNLFNIAYETSYNDSDKFEPPCIAICFSVTEILNFTLLLSSYPEIKRQAEKLMDINDRFTNCTAEQVLEDQDEGQKLIFEHLTLIQIDKMLIPMEKLFSWCYYLDQSMAQAKCDYGHARKYFYDHAVCQSFQFWPRIGITFNRSDLIIPGYRSLRLLNVGLDFRNQWAVNQLRVTAHRLNKVPWSQGESTIEVPVKSSHEIAYGLSFQEKTVRLLPPPYISNCKIPSKPYTSVGHCLSRCFMSSFTKITGRFPHHYVVNKPNDLRFLEGDGLAQYHELVTQLYSPCNKICGQVDCVVDTFEWRKVGRPIYNLQSGSKSLVLHFHPPSKLPLIKQAKPQINWLNYFSSVGSVISLYFGLSTLSLIDWLINNNQLQIVTFIRKLLSSDNQVKPLNVEILTFQRIDLKPKHYLTEVNSTIDSAIVNQYDTKFSSFND